MLRPEARGNGKPDKREILALATNTTTETNNPKSSKKERNVRKTEEELGSEEKAGNFNGALKWKKTKMAAFNL